MGAIQSSVNQALGVAAAAAGAVNHELGKAASTITERNLSDFGKAATDASQAQVENATQDVENAKEDAEKAHQRVVDSTKAKDTFKQNGGDMRTKEGRGLKQTLANNITAENDAQKSVEKAGMALDNIQKMQENKYKQWTEFSNKINDMVNLGSISSRLKAINTTKNLSNGGDFATKENVNITKESK